MRKSKLPLPYGSSWKAHDSCLLPATGLLPEGSCHNGPDELEPDSAKLLILADQD